MELPTPPYCRHVKQKWFVGERVRITKLPEPSLEGIDEDRMTSLGWIIGAHLKFPRVPAERRVWYMVRVDRPLLSMWEVKIEPGSDTMTLEVLPQQRR